LSFIASAVVLVNICISPLLSWYAATTFTVFVPVLFWMDAVTCCRTHLPQSWLSQNLADQHEGGV
jgi:hypothetical protein